MTHTYKIIGMTCTGCQYQVQNLLSQVTGVSDITVDFITGKVQIEVDEHLPLALLKNALKDYSQYQIPENKVDTQTNSTLS